MKQILDKQLATLEKIDKKLEQDRLLQISQAVVQAKTDKDINEDNDIIVEKLEGIQKTLEKGLASKESNTLNSNVIQLFKEVQKQTEKFTTRDKTQTEKSTTKDRMTIEQSEKITEKSTGLDQFKTLNEKIQDFRTDTAKSVKEFFTLKGFLNKTGIVSPESKGIVATALAKREAKQQYIKDRMSVDPNLVNLKQYGGDEKKLRADLAIQFDKQQKIKREQRESVGRSQEYQREVEGLRERGYGEEQIKRSKAFKNLQAETEKRRGISERLAEVDPRYRESAMRGFGDDKKEEPIRDRSKKEELSKDKESNVIPFSDENQLEASRLAQRQVGLLEKIEENTRGLRDLKGGEAKSAPVEEGGGGSLLDMLPGRGFLRGAKTLGGKILSGGKALAGGALRFAGSPLGMKLGAGLAVAGGAYTAYKGWTGAEEEKQQQLAQIDEQVKSGQITEQQANEQRAALDESTVEKKGGAVGEGTGMAAGGIAGAKLGAAAGAALGSFVPVVGTAIGAGAGALIGGAAGAFGGAKAGKVIGEYGGKAVNLGKRAVGAIGDKISSFVGGVKDSYNRGTGGTLEFQNKDEEVLKRAQAAGIVNEKGEITNSEKYEEINKQVTKEVLAKDPTANRTGDQFIGSKSSIKESETAGQGMVTTEQSQAQGITSKKSLFGSEFLGSLVSKKGLKTGGFLGTSSEQKSIESTTDSMMSSTDNTTSKFTEILGERISGGLFGKDKYKVSTGDGIDTGISKTQYNKIQELVAKGDPESQKQAMAMVEDIRKRSADAAQFEGAYDISKSPEELVGQPTPVLAEKSTSPKSSIFSNIGEKIGSALSGDRILSSMGPAGLAVSAAKNLFSFGGSDSGKEEQGKALPASSFSGDDLRPRMIAGQEWTPGKAFTKDQMKELEGRKNLTYAVAMQYEFQKTGKTAPITESVSRSNLSMVKPSPESTTSSSIKQASIMEREPPRTPLYDGSKKNADMAAATQQQPSAPIIVNAPTTNMTKSTQNTTLPTPIRNDDGAVRDYFSKRANFI